MELAQPEPLLQLASYLCVKTASLWLRLARAVSNSVLCKLARNRTCCAAVSTAVPRCSPVGFLAGEVKSDSAAFLFTPPGAPLSGSGTPGSSTGTPRGSTPRMSSPVWPRQATNASKSARGSLRTGNQCRQLPHVSHWLALNSWKH